MLCTELETDRVCSIYQSLIYFDFHHLVDFRHSQGPQLSLVSNRYTGPGRLKIDVLTEANVSYEINIKKFHSKM